MIKWKHQNPRGTYNKLVYEYETPAGEFYRITYDRRGDISRQNFVDRLLGPMRFHAKFLLPFFRSDSGRGIYPEHLRNQRHERRSGETAFALRSDLTITIGFVKNGLLADNAGAHMKRLICTDIGIRLAREENKICSQQEWRTLYASNGIPAEQSKAEIEGTVYYRCPAWLDMTIIQAFSD